MKRINEKKGKTILLVTHNTAIAEIAHRVVRLRSGRIVGVETNSLPLDPEELRW